MYDVIFDGRWRGAHGIGRFATEVEKALCLRDAGLRGNPASPLDCVYLSAKLLLTKNGIFFSPGFNYPLLYHGMGMLVVHDLIHFDVPAPHSFIKKIYCSSVLRYACRRASLVLTVSQFSADRIVAFAGVDPEKVVVVGNGVSSVFSVDGPIFSLGEDELYFLAISNGKHHKNTETVIKGFLDAKLGDKAKLIFVGAPSQQVAALVSKLRAHESIWFMGKVSDVELASLYRGAVALIFPSLYEGFGLPIVESMACGTPVITSNCTAMPEVAGGAALLVDPLSAEQIAASATQLLDDRDLRNTLAQKGVVRAGDFRWADVGTRIHAALAMLRIGVEVPERGKFS